MCQSVQLTYKFCGCDGEFYQQKCPKPTATCKLLLKNPINLPLTCHCEKHWPPTSQAAVSREDRGSGRSDTAHRTTLASEEHRRQQAGGGDRSRGSAGQHEQALDAVRGRGRAAGARERQIVEERDEWIRQRQREAAEFRQREREMEAYGQKWGRYAMRKKYPIAQARHEDAKRRKAQERAIAERGRAVRKHYGIRERSDGICAVM